jgi:antitoxin component of MazEF toxin-antitoxin module
MSVVLAQWGNSVGLRIPAGVLAKAGLKVGDQVEAEAQADQTLLIRRAVPAKRRVDIFSLIEVITPESLPDATQLDARPVGAELW